MALNGSQSELKMEQLLQLSNLSSHPTYTYVNLN